MYTDIIEITATKTTKKGGKVNRTIFLEIKETFLEHSREFTIQAIKNVLASWAIDDDDSTFEYVSHKVVNHKPIIMNPIHFEIEFNTLNA